MSCPSIRTPRDTHRENAGPYKGRALARIMKAFGDKAKFNQTLMGAGLRVL
jgi:hypothetical protein